MRLRWMWMTPALLVACAACTVDREQAHYNSTSVSYLVSDVDQVTTTQNAAAAFCGEYKRDAHLANVTQYTDATVATYDCRYEGDFTSLGYRDPNLSGSWLDYLDFLNPSDLIN